MDKIHIEGAEAQATSPEGKSASMPLGELMGRLNPKRFDSGDIIYPDGVKAVRSEVLQYYDQVHLCNKIEKKEME